MLLRVQEEWIKKEGTIVSEKSNPDGSYEIEVDVPLLGLWKYIETVIEEKDKAEKDKKE